MSEANEQIFVLEDERSETEKTKIVPDEIWIRIITELQRGADNWRSAVQILHNGMLISHTHHNLCSDWQVWQALAKRFPDYARLYKRHQATSVTWYDIVKERMSKNFIERVILVGDRELPECRVLVRVDGTGNLYIGNSISADMSNLIHEFNEFSPGLIVHDEIIKHDGFEYIRSNYSMGMFNTTFDYDVSKVVDLSIYDPFMLVLTETGSVVEFIFKPSWDTKWDEFSRPRMINFPNNVQIEKIYAMNYASMALADGYVWTWTVLDNPIGVAENIRTDPICLTALNNMYIYYIEQINQHTRMYYVPRSLVTESSKLQYKSPFKDDIIDPNALSIDVENSQVIALIADSVFTESELHEIAEKIRIAEEM